MPSWRPVQQSRHGRSGGNASGASATFVYRAEVVEESERPKWLKASDRPHDMPGWIYLVQVGWAALLLILVLTNVRGSPARAIAFACLLTRLRTRASATCHARAVWNPRRPLDEESSHALATALVVEIVRNQQRLGN